MFIPLIKKKEGQMPKHIAITTNGIFRHSQKSKCSLEDSWKKSFDIILETIRFQVDKNIPIITFHLVPMSLVKKEEFSEISSFISKFFEELKRNHLINENKVKVSVLGKWYDLPGELVESIKDVTRATKDYDSFFVNFCVNYDGKEE
ncbi:MAG: undecaprenyl diphosphate synthase family protein, partial [Nanoarchaeota archaeon]|nr:undecaprenyl diphosphate synthase family protein [Nanoarchaeota archaeon]